MKEVGLVNSEISDVISHLGHMDEVIVCDAGFPIPLGVRTVDVSLAANRPTVPELLAVLMEAFSVEALVMAEETRRHSPSRYAEIVQIVGADLPVATMPHAEFKVRSRTVKAVLRSGDFTAYSNVLLVSGAGNRWHVEQP